MSPNKWLPRRCRSSTPVHFVYNSNKGSPLAVSIFGDMLQTHQGVAYATLAIPNIWEMVPKHITEGAPKTVSRVKKQKKTKKAHTHPLRNTATAAFAEPQNHSTETRPNHNPLTSVPKMRKGLPHQATYPCPQNLGHPTPPSHPSFTARPMTTSTLDITH